MTDSMISLFIEYCNKSLPSNEVVSKPEQVFQWLKILSSKSDNKVGFKRLGDRTFKVFTAYRLFQNNPPSFGGYHLNVLLPFRSMVIYVSDETIELKSYTVRQIMNTDNQSFTDHMEVNRLTASISYEGSVISVSCEEGNWTLNTTTQIAPMEVEEEDDGSLFCSFRKACTVKQLNDLRELYPNHTFAFVLTNHNRYLCDYSEEFNGPTAILIGIRDRNSKEVNFNQDIFKTSKNVSVEEIKAFFAEKENNFFTNNYLNLQGFVMTDANGNVFRTFTRAYHAGTIKVPNNPNFFLSALQSYLRGSLHIYLQFKNRLLEYDEIKRDCSNVANAIRSVVQFIFMNFTDMKYMNVSGTWKKSYSKLNEAAYASLFSGYETDKQVYKKVLAGIQSFSIKNKMNLFNNPMRLETDTYSYIRTLAEKDSDFDLVVEMYLNYQSFKLNIFQTFGNVYNNKFEGSICDTFDKYIKKSVNVENVSASASASNE